MQEMIDIASGVVKPVEAEEIVSSSSEFGYLKFAHPQSPSFADMQKELENVESGDPVFSFNGFQSLDGVRLQIMGGESQMWCKFHKTKYHRTETTLTDPGKKTGWSECLFALALAFVDDDIIPIVCEFKGPKCRCAHDFRAAVERTEKDKWVSNNEAIAGFSPRHRIGMEIAMKEVPAKGDNFGYHIANGKCSTLTMEEATVFKKWSDNPKKKMAFIKALGKVAEDAAKARALAK
jgi:hypothetical protein